MKKRNICMGIAFAAAACLLSGCGTVTGNTLKVGVKDDVANFGLYDEESGRYSGMEIDLAQTLCEDLGYSKLELTTASAATREQLIDSGEVDMIIATYSITKQRQEKYDFSTPYYTDYVAVMVEESSRIRSLEDLNGCRIGVVKNSSNTLSMAQYMAEKGVIPEFDAAQFDAETFAGGVTFAEYDSYNAISDALECGEVDAFVADHSILSGYTKDDRVVLPDKFAEQEYGVCTKKGSGLSQKADEALRKRTEDGTLKGLVNKWGI